MEAGVREYLSRIGKRGGRKSRRRLTPEQARDMVRVREARRAFRKYAARCFWSFDPEYRIKLEDVAWVAEQLRRYGDRETFCLAQRLCH
jgi:hypothetical protein